MTSSDSVPLSNSSIGSSLSVDTGEKIVESWSGIIAELWNNPNRPFWDVKFLVGENAEEIKAHKIILGSKSEVFKRDLYELASEEPSQIVLNCIRPNTFKQLLSFLYKGETDSSMKDKDIPALAVAAKKYKVRNLVTVCVQEVLKNDPVTWYQKLRKEGKHLLANDLWSFILGFGEAVLESAEFVNMSNGNLCKLLTSNEMDCRHELKVWEAVHRWTVHQCKQRNKVLTTASLRFELRDALPLALGRFPIEELPTFDDFEDFQKKQNPKLLTTKERDDMLAYYVLETEARPAWIKTKPNSLSSQLSQASSTFSKKMDSQLQTPKTECTENTNDIPSSVVETISTASSSNILSAVKAESESKDLRTDESNEICSDFTSSTQNEENSPNIAFSQNIFERESSEEREKTNTSLILPIPISSEGQNLHLLSTISTDTCSNASQNSDELVPFTPKTKNGRNVERKRSASLLQTLPTPIKKKPRNVSTSQKKTPKILKLASSKKSQSQSSSITCTPKIKVKRNPHIQKMEIKILGPDASEVFGEAGSLQYADLISTCKSFSKIKKISLTNVDVIDCRGNRQEQFQKVLLNELKEFRLEIYLGPLSLEKLQEIADKINFEEYLFFIHIQDVNEDFVKTLQKYAIHLSLNGAIALSISPKDKSIAAALTKGVPDLIGNYRGMAKSLALGYCEFVHKLCDFPCDKLTTLTICKATFPKDSCHLDFLRKCCKLENLTWYDFKEKGLHLEKDLTSHSKLKKIAIFNAKLRIPSAPSNWAKVPQFPKLETLIITGGSWEPVEGIINVLFPKLKFAFFGGPYSRPSCSLLQELRDMPSILTIEMWYFDIDADLASSPSASQTRTRTKAEDLRCKIADWLTLMGIGTKTCQFMLQRRKPGSSGVWTGNKLKESDFEERKYALFELEKLFTNFQSLTEVDHSF